MVRALGDQHGVQPEPRFTTAAGPGRVRARARPLGHLSEGGEDVRGLVELLGAVAAQPAFAGTPSSGRNLCRPNTGLAG
jgi:hypothetical protein